MSNQNLTDQNPAAAHVVPADQNPTAATAAPVLPVVRKLPVENPAAATVQIPIAARVKFKIILDDGTSFTHVMEPTFKSKSKAEIFFSDFKGEMEYLLQSMITKNIRNEED